MLRPGSPGPVVDGVDAVRDHHAGEQRDPDQVGGVGAPGADLGADTGSFGTVVPAGVPAGSGPEGWPGLGWIAREPSRCLSVAMDQSTVRLPPHRPGGIRVRIF